MDTLKYAALCLIMLPICAYCACDEAAGFCNRTDGSTGWCRNGTCVHLSATVRNNLRFNIIVKYPETTLQVKCFIYNCKYS